MDQPEPPAKENWVNKLFGDIGDQLQDLTYVEVATGSAKVLSDVKINPGAKDVLDELNRTGVTVLARTRIELDGDIVMLLPTEGEGGVIKINKEVMDLHKENTTVAVNNWNNFLNLILATVKVLTTLLGLKEGELLDKLSFKVESP
jgi:hypothetical protein